jgi:hypothetical protein
MIVLVSPASITSDLIKREVEYALTSERFQDRLFPLIIRPTLHVPGYFSLITVFDATENRKRGLKSNEPLPRLSRNSTCWRTQRHSELGQSHFPIRQNRETRKIKSSEYRPSPW